MDIYNWTIKKRKAIFEEIESGLYDHDDDTYETLFSQWDQLGMWQRNLSTMDNVYQSVMCLQLPIASEDTFNNMLQQEHHELHTR